VLLMDVTVVGPLPPFPSKQNSQNAKERAIQGVSGIALAAGVALIPGGIPISCSEDGSILVRSVNACSIARW
jgi:hypothetical protein